MWYPPRTQLSFPCCWGYRRLTTPSCSLHPMTVVIGLSGPHFLVAIWENTIGPSSSRARCAVSKCLCWNCSAAHLLPVFNPASFTPPQLSVLRAHHKKFPGWNFPFQSLFSGKLSWNMYCLLGTLYHLLPQKSCNENFRQLLTSLFWRREKIVKNVCIFCAESH